jgi:ABC-type antimicrobial peptide transport system permease subunit
VFRAVLAELMLVGVVAGVAGAALAAGLVAAFSLHLPLLRTLLVVPLAVVLAIVAGLLPAYRAARGKPLDAILPPVTGGGRGRRVHGIATIALVNLGRLPGRTLVGAAGLMLGVAALTILVAIEHGFQGTLVGTVLGSAISVQVRGSDFVALTLTLVLAALSAGDVLYLNLRERQAEVVTLQTLGWSDAETRRLVAIEALLLAVGASLGGAAIGIVLGALVLGVGLLVLLIAAAIAAAAAAAAAMASSLLPLLRIRTLSAPEILAAE